MGAKRKQRISKRILNEAKAEELRRRREQCIEEMAMMGVCWTFAEANGFGDEVGNFSKLLEDVTMSGSTLFLSAIV